MPRELSVSLEHCGLEARWLKILKDLEIENFEALQARANKGDLYDVLEKAAKDGEKNALLRFVSEASEMSLELSACLEYCGLEERWLKIFKKLDIETFESLKARINDEDFHEVLEKSATEEEKKAIRRITSKEGVDYVEKVRAFITYLENTGLDASWLRKTFSIEGISTLEDLHKVSGNLEKYEKLTQDMNEVETFAIREMMEISPEVAAEYEIKCIIRRLGLESKYWFPVLTNELGISHPLLLKFLGSPDCLLLQSYARHENETAIIRQHFVELIDVPISQRLLKDGEKGFQLYNTIEEHLHELKELIAKRQNDTDKLWNSNLYEQNEKLMSLKIRSKEEIIGMLLQIPKSEFTEPDHSMLTKLEKLEQQIRGLNQRELLIPDLNEKNIVEKISDGLLLRGICMVEEHMVKFPPRKKVIRKPPEFFLSEPSLPHKNSAIYFTAKNLQDQFIMSMRYNGYSITVADMDDNVDPLQMTEQQSCAKESGYALLRYSMIPTACGTFDVDNLALSDDALRELKEIEDAEGLPNEALYKKCEDFFYEYGSHISVGQVHFGGIFMVKLSYTGNVQENQDILNKVASDTMNEFMKFGRNSLRNDGSLDYDVSETLKVKYREFDFENLSLSVETIGGQSIAFSYLHWKLGLIRDNTSWAVIDRGFTVKGIWELLEYHHNNFENSSVLASILCSAWEAKSGLKPKQLPNPKYLIKVPQRLGELCTFIESCVTDPSLSKDCGKFLEYIHSEKEELTLISRHPDLWHAAASKHPCIFNFFEAVAQRKDNCFKPNFQSSNYLFLQLVEGFASSNYMEKDAIIKWVTANESQSQKHISKSMAVLLNFISSIKKFVIPWITIAGKNKHKGSEWAVDGRRICVTNDLAVLADHVLERLRNLGEHHTAYLLTLLLVAIGYDTKSKSFTVLLSDEILNGFLKNFEEKKKAFLTCRDKSAQSVECYLLKVALDITKGLPACSKTISNVSKLMEVMKPSFDMQINQVLGKYGRDPSQWDKLESFVNSVLYGTGQDDKNPNTFGTGLEKIMQSPSVSPDESESPVIQLHVPSINSVSAKHNGEPNVLDILGLTEYFPAKINLQLVMQAPPDKLDTMHDIPWYVLQKLIMLDYTARNIGSLPRDLRAVKKSELVNSRNNERVDDFVNDLFSCISSVSETNLILMPHPLDVLVAIFLCSSDFLQQILAEKMYMCHVSIPILLPDHYNGKLTYMLWALRTVICEYELPDGKAVETSVVSCSIPVVSFLRLGKVSRSKSKLLNDVINSQGHNTFFHRDCASSIMYPKLSEGLADVAWCLPSKQPNSLLNEAVTYINLHGNGNCFPVQCNFLVRASNVIVTLMAIEEFDNPDSVAFIKNVISSNAKLVLIIGKSPGSVPGNHKESFTKLLTEVGSELRMETIILDFNSTGLKNASEMCSETTSSIIESLNKTRSCSLAENKKLAENLGIIVDENDPVCVLGQVLAKDVFNHIDSNNLATVKSEMLPLQGDLWHQWGILEKREHRKQGEAHCSEHYAAKLHEQKLDLRCKQLQICNTLPRLMELFLSKLVQLEGTRKLHFLKWLMIYFDEASRKALPDLIKQYSSKWNEINQFKGQRQDEADVYMMVLQDDLCKIEEKLALTSLGLEHLMREVGQTFEAVASLSNKVTSNLKDSISKLPRIMAELMLSGYPLEIMDGDASHVPLSWVTAVLSELKMIIGDRRIFVLSVLGVQSSGKSTLLNTMFGLQFAVSAGRCTRGVYAQLVPVPKYESNSLYDYILVVDTEGLRAPELGSTKYQHDNELATFVIGLGDMTLINIKGENPTDMQDVLQIVVHAFLRMQLVNKNLKLQSSCFFIHQNVGAVNAAGKMIFGQQKLLENLDQITVAAAEQENVRGIYAFKEIIDFDVEKNVWYFSDLWQGDPPMAPANPGYSKKVQEVKITLLKEIMKNKKSSSSISSICLRIHDLWKGILAENFVFSFKNSLELRAYGSLDSTLTDLSWSLQNDALKWFNRARNQIMSSEKALGTLEANLCCEFSTYYIQIYDEAENKLTCYFERSDEKDILEQWRERSLLKLKNKKEETMKNIINALKKEFEMRKEELNQIAKTEVYKEEIQHLAKKLATELQGKQNVSDKELELKFNCMWNKWMSSLPSHQTGDNIDICSTVLCSMFEMLTSNENLLVHELKKFPQWIANKKFRGNFTLLPDHLTSRKKILFLRLSVSNQSYEIAYELINSLLEDIEEYLNCLEGSNFSPAQVGTVIKKACDMIARNNGADMPFWFSTLFQVHLVIYVCRYAEFRFRVIHHNYIKETDPKTIVERNYREQFLKLFKNKYKKSKNEKMVADVLCTCLLDSISKALLGDMSRELANDVRCNVSSLHTKGELLNTILKDLLKLMCFKEYLLYLKDIKGCIRKWVKTYTNNYVFKRRKNGISRYAELALLKIEKYIHNITEAIDDATEQAKRNSFTVDLQLWLKIFHEGIKGNLPLPESNLSLISKETIEDLGFFKESLKKSLFSCKRALENKAKLVSEVELCLEKNSVYFLLEKECLGCCERCPFCKAPCSLTITRHDVQHSALQHYPQAVGTYRCQVTQKLTIENCSTLLCSNATFTNPDTNWEIYPYKDYSKFYPDWKIHGDASMEASLYWKWFMANYAPQLAVEFRAVVPDIPHAWTLITPKEAEESLNQ